MPDPIPRGPFDQGLFLAHFNKGRELFEARRLDEAERQLEEAYLLRPRDPRVLNLLGLVYFRGEKLDKAEEVYRKLIAESPEAHTLHYNLGLICFKLGRLEDAESAFLKALDLTQGNPKIHFYLGSIYEKLHRYTDAIYQYRQAGPDGPTAAGPARQEGTTPPPCSSPT
jgi:tetratricopeptide (TPR) repeat protein